MTAALAPNSANATVSVTASLSNFNLILIDTNPYDGVNPYIYINGFGSANTMTGIIVSNPAQTEGSGSNFNINGSGFSFGSYNSDGKNLVEAGSSVAVSGVPTTWAHGYSFSTFLNAFNPINLNLIATGSSMGATGTAGIDYSSFMSNAEWSSGNFQISPNTMAILTATASVNFSLVDDHQIVSPYSKNEIAGAGFSLSANGYSDIWGGSSGTYQSFDSTTNKYQSVNSSLSKTMITSYFNNTSNFTQGSFSAAVSVSGSSMAPAIPEPETYAMMLTGLFAVGIGARRGRRVGQLSDCRVSHSGNRLN